MWPSCSLPFFFIGYVAHVTREDARGWGGVEHTHTHPSVATRLRRERETHTHARGELAYTPILAPLHYTHVIYSGPFGVMKFIQRLNIPPALQAPPESQWITVHRLGAYHSTTSIMYQRTQPCPSHEVLSLTWCLKLIWGAGGYFSGSGPGSCNNGHHFSAPPQGEVYLRGRLAEPAR